MFLMALVGFSLGEILKTVKNSHVFTIRENPVDPAYGRDFTLDALNLPHSRLFQC